MNTTWVYLKSTDKDGFVTITEHACWDAVMFVACQRERLHDEGGTCVQILRSDFLAANPHRGRNPI